MRTIREKTFKTYKIDRPLEIANPKEGTNIIPLYPQVEDMARPKEDVKQAVKSPREEICLYCANRQFDVCQPCGEEAKYRHLVPVMLESWENFDHLVMRNLVDWNPASRLAALYLLAYYK